MDEQGMLLYCVITTRKTRKLAGTIMVIREDQGEQSRVNKGCAGKINVFRQRKSRK